MAKTVRQKRRNKSSRAIVRLPNSRKKRLNPTGNAIVAAAWSVSLPVLWHVASLLRADTAPLARNKKETLTQNYRRLGLVTRLQKAAGGVEKFPNQPLRSTAEDGNHPLAIASAAASSALGEVRVERDAAGRIVRLVQPAVDNPLNDPLHHLDSDDDGQEWGGIEGEDEDEDEDENDDDKDDDDDESARLSYAPWSARPAGPSSRGADTRASASGSGWAPWCRGTATTRPPWPGPPAEPHAADGRRSCREDTQDERGPVTMNLSS